ncbi:MAG: hypothetical protein Ct9H300mP32_0590 [Verrucomicrobiota bacterium]|nr:MAG: hypothetical protein Ct9H300mP32_0590 [Verrucomicrobiota bacterium]
MSTPRAGVKAFFSDEPSVRFSAFDGEQFARDLSMYSITRRHRPSRSVWAQSRRR